MNRHPSLTDDMTTGPRRMASWERLSSGKAENAMTSTRLPNSDVCVRMPDLRLGRSGVPHSPTHPSDSHQATSDMPPLGNPGNAPWRSLGPAAHEARLVDPAPAAAMAPVTAPLSAAAHDTASVTAGPSHELEHRTPRDGQRDVWQQLTQPAASGGPDTTEVTAAAAANTTPRPQRGREPGALRRWGTQLGVTIAAAVLLAVVHHALTAPATQSTPETAPVTWSSDQVVLGTPVPMTDAQPGTSPESATLPTEDGSDAQLNTTRVAQRPADSTGRAVPPPQDSETPAAELPPPLSASDGVNGGLDAAPNAADAMPPESPGPAFAPPEMFNQTETPADAIDAPPLVAPASISPSSPNATAVGAESTTAPPLATAAGLPDNPGTGSPAKPNYPLTSQYDVPTYLLQGPVAAPAPSGPTAASPPPAAQATTPAASPYPYTNNPFAQPLQPSGTPGPTARLDKKIMTTAPTAIPPVQR